MERPPLSLAKKLTIWCGSYAFAGVAFVYYFGMPLASFILVGIFTLGVTLYRHYQKKD